MQKHQIEPVILCPTHKGDLTSNEKAVCTNVKNSKWIAEYTILGNMHKALLWCIMIIK